MPSRIPVLMLAVALIARKVTETLKGSKVTVELLAATEAKSASATTPKRAKERVCMAGEYRPE